MSYKISSSIPNKISKQQKETTSQHEKINIVTSSESIKLKREIRILKGKLDKNKENNKDTNISLYPKDLLKHQISSSTKSIKTLPTTNSSAISVRNLGTPSTTEGKLEPFSIDPFNLKDIENINENSNDLRESNSNSEKKKPKDESENTPILTLKIKIERKEKVFVLRKYDDLFETLLQFFINNNLKDKLVKPIGDKIFTALNKFFWLVDDSTKFGNYDKKYVNDLYKIWIKTDGRIPIQKNF